MRLQGGCAVSNCQSPIRALAKPTACVCLLLLIVANLSLSPSLVEAQHPTQFTPFGVKKGGTRFANNSDHSYRTVESHPGERYLWEHRFDGAGGQNVYNSTDLNLRRAYAHEIYFPDVLWYVIPLTGNTAGSYRCTLPKSDSVCDVGTIIIADDAHNLSPLLQNNLVCHELGHSIGFGHGITRDSCMSGGDNNALNPREIGLINFKY